MDEALGVRPVGGVEHPLAGRLGLLGATEVDGREGHQGDPGVAVLVVVPAEEGAAEGARVLDRLEPGGEAGPVLEGVELAPRSPAPAGPSACARACAQAPRAPRRRAGAARWSDPRSRAPRGAAAPRPHPARRRHPPPAEPAACTRRLRLAPARARRAHCSRSTTSRAPFSPSVFTDSSDSSVSRDVGREGRSPGIAT